MKEKRSGIFKLLYVAIIIACIVVPAISVAPDFISPQKITNILPASGMYPLFPPSTKGTDLNNLPCNNDPVIINNYSYENRTPYESGHGSSGISVKVAGSAPINIHATWDVTRENLTAMTAKSNSINGVQIFPDDHIWNVPADNLLVDPCSSAYIEKIGISTSLHPDFGAMWQGSIIGIPYNVVPGTQPKKTI